MDATTALRRSELAWVRRVLKSWDSDPIEDNHFARLWLGRERQIFIVAEATVSARSRLIEVARARSETLWIVSRAGRKALVLIGTAAEQNAELDHRLSEYAAYRRRRNREKRAPGFYLSEHVEALWRIQEGRCYFSGAVLGSDFKTAKFSIDHLWPLATRMFAPAFGTNWPTNLALVTKSVNSMKGGLDAETFAADVRKRKAFVLRPVRERNRIDRLRRDEFRAFMTLHCSADEIDWLG